MGIDKDGSADAGLRKWLLYMSMVGLQLCDADRSTGVIRVDSFVK